MTVFSCCDIGRDRTSAMEPSRIVHSPKATAASDAASTAVCTRFSTGSTLRSSGKIVYRQHLRPPDGQGLDEQLRPSLVFAGDKPVAEDQSGHREKDQQEGGRSVERRHGALLGGRAEQDEAEDDGQHEEEEKHGD